MEPETDRLLERWIAGDAEAAAELYERYYQRAWRFGLALTRREMEAEEIAAEAMAAGLEVLRGGRRPERFTGWLLGVVKHLAWRRNKADERPELPRQDALPDPREPRPSAVLREKEMKSLLGRALEGLDPGERQILEGRVLHRSTREELARLRGCSIDTVDRTLARAMAKMRHQLSGHFTTMILPSPSPTMEQIQALRPAFREAFLLRHVEGRSVEDVAARTGVPAETVRERLAYAYARLGCSPATDFSPLRPKL